MLDYTKAALTKTINDTKKIAYFCSISTQLIYIAYLIYALCAGVGFSAVNIILLVLSVLYVGYYSLTLYPRGKKERRARYDARRIYKYTKLTLQALTLIFMIYGIFMASSEKSTVTIMFAAVSLVFWILSLLLEVTIAVLNSYKDLLIEGLKADLEVITKPIDAAKGFVRRITGKEEPKKEERAPSKRRLLLDAIVGKAKANKSEEKRRRTAPDKEEDFEDKTNETVTK